MPLEAATHISGLNPANPTGGDPIAAGDDHLRLLKTTLKNSFPNISAPVTSSPLGLNTALVPPGCILPWFASIDAPIPTGWALCDGANGTPDLRGRVLLGTSSAFPHQTSGGSLTATTTEAGSHTHTTSSGGAHDHGGVTFSVGLTIDQLPPHSHGAGFAVNGTANTGIASLDATDGGSYFSLQDIQTQGAGRAHGHGIEPVGGHTHPVVGVGGHIHSVSTVQPYFSINFIMKLAYI